MTTYYTYRSFEEFEGGRSYIGVRKCPAGKTPETDPYQGSYSDKTFSPTAKEILEVYGCKEEALQAEIELHIQYDVAKNPRFANKARATSTKFTCELSGENHPNYGKLLPEETRRKMSESRKGKTPSEETRKKISEANRGEKNANYGKSHSKSAREKMSESHKGKTLSEETRIKISEACKGERNPMYGKSLPKSTREKISKTLAKKRDLVHSLHGKILQVSTGELVLMFPGENLLQTSLNKVALGKRSHHKGWKSC